MEHSSPDTCPCGSARSYEQCCKDFHDGKQKAKTPESLLRSRFSAFFLENLDYVFDTSASKNQNEGLRQSLREVSKSTQWRSLHILERFPHTQDLIGQKIRYVAFFEREGTPFQIHELSYFCVENEIIRYDRGDFLKAHSLGRNEVCWCGSGNKLKRCHEITPPTL